MSRAGAALVAGVLIMAGPAEAAPLRVMSLDQCADQYVLALTPGAELALSPRADDPDSWMRRQASGHRRLRPTLEAAIGFRPDVVVRYWGGDPRMLRALEQRGVRVLTIADAHDMDGVRADVRHVAEGLGASGAGETLVRGMAARLAAADRGGGSARSAVYLTAGGFTAGPGTLIDAILTAAGLRNATRSPGFSALSVERIALRPPARFVLGFFEQVRADWRGAGRHPVVRRAAAARTSASLPAAALSCPGWFAADAAALLARAGR